MLKYGLLLIVIGTSVAALFMFLYVIMDQINRHIELVEKNAHTYAANMALQMRPHFIYNVMTSIYYLCGSDPERAKQVTKDFTEYLRKNFSALAKEGTIPFTEELDHTKAYLAVEKSRFSDSLFVTYDTPHVMFRIPPLVLQPIVENAVKHGVDPERDPLNISITTEHTGHGSMITVFDNGPGFKDTDNDEPHIALNNIMTRLKLSCGGSLTIEPAEEGGTRVIIFIPDKPEH